MKKFMMMFLLAISVASSGYAANAPQGMKPGMMMGMMNHDQMMQMQEHIEQMQKLMGDIKMEHDPQQRMQMLNEHAKQMNEAMGMMGGAMMGEPGNKNLADMNMQERMDLMQNQMGMMQQMMQQMMEHFSATTEDDDVN